LGDVRSNKVTSEKMSDVMRKQVGGSLKGEGGYLSLGDESISPEFIVKTGINKYGDVTEPSIVKLSIERKAEIERNNKINDTINRNKLSEDYPPQIPSSEPIEGKLKDGHIERDGKFLKEVTESEAISKDGRIKEGYQKLEDKYFREVPESEAKIPIEEVDGIPEYKEEKGYLALGKVEGLPILGSQEFITADKVKDSLDALFSEEGKESKYADENIDKDLVRETPSYYKEAMGKYKPSEYKAVEGKEAEEKPIEYKVTEEKTVGYKPAEEKTTEYKPVEEKPTEYKPIGEKPEGYKPTGYPTTGYPPEGYKPTGYPTTGYPPGKPTPILPPPDEQSGGKKVKIPFGATTWRQGNRWGYVTAEELMKIEPQKNVIWLKKGEIPEGIYRYATGRGSARKTVQVLPREAVFEYTPDSPAVIDMGWATVQIYKQNDGVLGMKFLGGKKAAEKRWTEEKAEVAAEKQKQLTEKVEKELAQEQILQVKQETPIVKQGVTPVKAEEPQAEIQKSKEDLFNIGQAQTESEVAKLEPAKAKSLDTRIEYENLKQIAENKSEIDKDNIDYQEKYAELVGLAGKRGYKIRDVAYDDLKDYAAMNPIFAKQIGYEMPSDEIYMNSKWNGNIQTKYENLRHELEEMAELEKKNPYWKAHLVAYEGEDNPDLESISLPKDISVNNGRMRKPHNFERAIRERWGELDSSLGRRRNGGRRGREIPPVESGIKSRYYLGEEIHDY
jgi:hypothetical protein